MIEDTQAYLALHAPFIIMMLWIAATEHSSRWLKTTAIVFISVHLITIAAYFANLGDDFAIAAYWSMYLAIPGAVLYFKLISKPPELRRPLLYVPLALLVVPVLGFAGIVTALMIAPMDWR